MSHFHQRSLPVFNGARVFDPRRISVSVAGPYAEGDADLRLLLLQWYRRVRRAQLAQGDAASHYSKQSRWLGVPTVVLTALVSTSVFATLTKPADLWLQILTGMVSVAASVLAALQTFLRSSDEAGIHQAASREYGALRREIAQVGAVGGKPRDELETAIDRIRERYDEISTASPNVPQATFGKYETSTRNYFPPEFSMWPEAGEFGSTMPTPDRLPS